MGRRREVEASVARCLRTPPDVATRQGLKSVFQTALRGLSHRSIVVVGNYCYGPITAEPYRAKARPLHPRRSYFAPITGPRFVVARSVGAPDRGLTRLRSREPVVEAPGTAPGSDRFIPTAIYRHSRQAGIGNIGATAGKIKWARVPQPSERGHMCPRCDSAVRLLLPSPTGEVGGRSRPGGGSAALVVDRKIPPPQPSPSRGRGRVQPL